MDNEQANPPSGTRQVELRKETGTVHNGSRINPLNLVRITAEQYITEGSGPTIPDCDVVVTIEKGLGRRGGKVVHEIDKSGLTYPAPSTHMLPYQVYALTVKPDSPHAEFNSALRNFCNRLGLDENVARGISCEASNFEGF